MNASKTTGMGFTTQIAFYGLLWESVLDLLENSTGLGPMDFAHMDVPWMFLYPWVSKNENYFGQVSYKPIVVRISLIIVRFQYEYC